MQPRGPRQLPAFSRCWRCGLSNGPKATEWTASGIAEAFSNPLQHVREDFGTTRIDSNLSQKDLLFGVYTIDDSDATTPSANPYSSIYERLG